MPLAVESSLRLCRQTWCIARAVISAGGRLLEETNLQVVTLDEL